MGSIGGPIWTAKAEPPVYIYVIIFGFLVTMVCFGAYRPQGPLLALVSLYTVFIDLVLYLILALSDPFQGRIGVDPTTFEHLLETLRAENGQQRSHRVVRKLKPIHNLVEMESGHSRVRKRCSEKCMRLSRRGETGLPQAGSVRDQAKPDSFCNRFAATVDV